MSETENHKPRPVYRNIHISQILSYRLPPAGMVSILHRLSGAFLFFSLPFILYLFDKSLTSEISFDAFKQLFSCLPVKILILGLSWAFLHHLFAGLRYLCMDINHHCVTKEKAKRSAFIVLFISLAVTLAVAAKLFGVF